MRGVSEVIAIILILMITISIAGLAYTFMSSTMASTTSAASSAVTTTTSSMMTSFTIESMDVAKLYIRNTGQNTISSLSVYVNDEPAVFIITPASITAGSIGSVTIYSFIPDGATIKVTSSSGFSASKVAHPCERAIGCWNFDEGTGTTAYDSSPYGNTGTLVNGPTWTSGKYGGGLLFDGNNDYIDISNPGLFNMTSKVTIEAWIKPVNLSTNIAIFGNDGAYFMRQNGPNLQIWYYNNTGTLNYVHTAYPASPLNVWYHIVGMIDSSGNASVYMNDLLKNTLPFVGSSIASSSAGFQIGRVPVGGINFNGTIDEVRIYSRAIY